MIAARKPINPLRSMPATPVAFLDSTCRDRNRLNTTHLDEVIRARRLRETYGPAFTPDWEPAAGMEPAAPWANRLVGFVAVALLLLAFFLMATELMAGESPVLVQPPYPPTEGEVFVYHDGTLQRLKAWEGVAGCDLPAVLTALRDAKWWFVERAEGHDPREQFSVIRTPAQILRDKADFAAAREQVEYRIDATLEACAGVKP